MSAMSQQSLSSATRAGIISLLGLVIVACQTKQTGKPNSGPNANQQAIEKYLITPSQEPQLSPNQLVNLLRQKVKYVFVIYQENRSFDSYFGTYPGAEGIFSHSPQQTHGFEQPLINTDGTTGTVRPFRIGPKEYAADTDDVDHSHSSIVAKMDIKNGEPEMDRFALTEEKDRK